MDANQKTSQFQLRLQKKIIRLREENQRFREMNHDLQRQNLKMRLDFEVLCANPERSAAERIMDRYRVRKSIIGETLAALKNWSVAVAISVFNQN